MNFLISAKPSKFVSHKAKISREFDPWNDLEATTLERKPHVLLQLRFRDLYDSKLDLLRTFDNIAISVNCKIRQNQKVKL